MARVWHYKDEKGVDVIAEWLSALQKRERIKLQLKIDMLSRYGSELPPLLLSETGEPHIKKLKVHGKIQLRPLLCKITEDDDVNEEFVFLLGAFEVQSKYVPANALEIAVSHRENLLKDGTRKTIHVRNNK